jgi:hypothetical protein
MLKKLLLSFGVTIVFLLVVVGTLYAFGGEQTPSPRVQAAYAADVAAGTQPALGSRFVIPVPGCVCHSDDPVLQMQHAGRRMDECGTCHSR